jgi:hypothetical protein
MRVTHGQRSGRSTCGGVRVGAATAIEVAGVALAHSTSSSSSNLAQLSAPDVGCVEDICISLRISISIIISITIIIRFVIRIVVHIFDY